MSYAFGLQDGVVKETAKPNMSNQEQQVASIFSNPAMQSNTYSQNISSLPSYTQPQVSQIPQILQSIPTSAPVVQPISKQEIQNSIQPNLTQIPSTSQLTTQSTTLTNVSPKSTFLVPYMPSVKAQQLSNGQTYFVLPPDEICNMLSQNAVIIRKFISDVNNGKQIDVTEYSGLHTSVFLLSLFTKQKNGTLSKTGVPVSTYQNLVKKLKQVQLHSQNKQYKYLL